MIESLENALKAGTMEGMENALSDIDQFSNQMSNERSDIGARYNRLELINSRLSEQEETATKVCQTTKMLSLKKSLLNLLHSNRFTELHLP